MNDLPPSQEPPFNTPAEIGARFVCLVYLACATAGVVCPLYALVSRDATTFLIGLCAGVLAWLCRSWLQEPQQFARIKDLFEEVPSGALTPRTDVGETSLDRLIPLLHQLDELERKRGARDFDPWALQSVRREIKALVAEHPALARAFRS
jgi:hypothetical protein